MFAMFNGQPIFGPRGPAGSDGTPIGTIISYMGINAPKDYLICDGSIYNIFDYSELADFFKIQFGSENYFGGDGTTTFAVPDMRNLFLRGYHGKAGATLSGNIGLKQEATIIPYVRFNGDNAIQMFNGGIITPANTDSLIGMSHVTQVNSGTTPIFSQPHSFTARPVNMAVLYCIKATITEPRQELYSEEETRIGTWVDGKPVYQRAFNTTTGPSANTWHFTGIVIPDFDTYIELFGSVKHASTGNVSLIPNHETGQEFSILYAGPSSSGMTEGINILFTNEALINCECLIVIKYTKTTDTGVSA